MHRNIMLPLGVIANGVSACRIFLGLRKVRLGPSRARSVLLFCRCLMGRHSAIFKLQFLSPDIFVVPFLNLVP